MAATRQNPVFQIYQDNFRPQTMPPNASRPRPQLQPSPIPLQPATNFSQSVNVPSTSTAPPSYQMSPSKSQPNSPQVQQFPQMNYVPISAPLASNMYGVSPTKPPRAPNYVETLPSQPLFTTFSSNIESYSGQFHVVSSQNETSDFPVPSFPRRQNLKRSFSDVTALNDRNTKKARFEDEDDGQLPNPEDMLPVEDDGNKPGYSYAQMIGMAILRAPQRRLTLAQIYDWISTTFAFYREDTKQGWHNSIRHNLSLNKAFKKQERPKGDAGKGSYWIIEPGMEVQFYREKVRKNPNLVSMGLQSGMRADIHVMAQPLAEALTPSWSVPMTAPIPPRPQTAPALPELSSDATLPASDPALHEDGTTQDTAPLSPQVPSSPNPVLNSSPPVASNHHRTISSPVIKRPSSRVHKRSNTAVDDSGYWTELSSSVRKSRVHKSGVMLTSEINIEPPPTKLGRAEDAIRRILSSPRVTPNPRRRSTLSEFDHSSSPVRPSPTFQRHPATPAVIFKKPALKPPPSVSPNTQLQRHRAQMLEYQDSPIKAAGLAEVSLPGFSPYTGLPTFRNEFDEQFCIFEDVLSGPALTPGAGSSPIRSIRKPILQRANTSTGVLRDMSGNTRLNAKTPTKVPSLKPPFKPMPFTGSPLKKSVIQIATDDVFGEFDGFDENTFVNNDEFDTTLIDGENSSELGDDGVDLVRGFAFIGQGQDLSMAKGLKPQLSKQKGSSLSRPPLGLRSNTTAF